MSGAPHPVIGVGGPGPWIILGILVLTAVGALIVTLDVARAIARGEGRGVRPLWAVPQIAYLGAFAWGIATRATGYSPRAILVTILVAIPGQIAYVLRVVSPKRPASGSRTDGGDLVATPTGEKP